MQESRILGLSKAFKALTPKLEKTHKTSKYTINIYSFDTGPNTWKYSCASIVSNNTSEEIIKIYRNYGSFPFALIENHKEDSHDYFICSTHYQGQTIVCLDEDWYFNEEKYLDGFCCAEYLPSESGKYIKITGCYWGGPYYDIIVDFSKPRNAPLAKLAEGESPEGISTTWDIDIDESKLYDCIYLGNDDEDNQVYVFKKWMAPESYRSLGCKE